MDAVWGEKYGAISGGFHIRSCLKLKCMRFPQAVPEIPVENVEKAAAYYVNVLGFSFDWGDDAGGIGGISQGDCRMFLTNASFRESHGTSGPATIWLNVASKAEVDELFRRWRAAAAKILAEPEDKPWRLREFTAADLDSNQLRVFYDFSTDSASR
ncbi:MAG TPA: VOC family protein [Bryobacteraceae bacterium]|jgi:uncharacterized glyoxalase superfamily protein PhnB